MNRVGQIVVRAVRVITILLAILSCVIVVALLLLTCADIALRHLGHRGYPVVVELTQVLLPVAAMGGMGYAASQGAHIATDLGTSRLPARAVAPVRLIGLGAVAAFLVVVVVESVSRAQETISVGEATIGIDSIPTWPARVAIVVGFVSFLGELVIAEIKTATASRRSPLPPGSPVERGGMAL